ncbi:hypothetical protein [Streptomyces sp. GbtcB6]|uniref:hypothetical protein n=1 Tax=Streptomyces sp. GbtcB6 TaxID=2824751 RepID=UPI001C2F19C4|nr:hypothetical protein [Streptomyces sp. GbtcB6]
MYIGAVQLLLNHPLVMIGATGDIEDFAETPLSGPFAPGTSHLAVPARAQIATVLVRLWNGAHPDTGTVVFESSLTLPDGAIAVFDVDRVVRFVRQVGKPGRQSLTIRVDDLKRASRIDVVVNRGPGRVSLNRIPGYALPGVDGVSDSFASADALALILSSESQPEARFITALDLVISEWGKDVSQRNERLNSYRVQRITEWLKSAYPEVDHELWSGISEFIERAISGELDNPDGTAAILIAGSVIRKIEESYLSL